MLQNRTIGVVGGGQLGRMLALAGYPLGLRFRFLDPSPEACAGQVGELIVGDYTDETQLAELARGAAVVTYEFENVPVATAHYLQQFGPVYPPPHALEVAQDRLVEKQFFQHHGIPTPRFLPVDSRDDLHSAVAELGLPAVLKTRRLGYDGKGQALLQTAADLDPAWEQLSGVPLILEAFVPFESEVSIVMARAVDGITAAYPLSTNTHTNGILHSSKSFGQHPYQTLAETYAARVLTELEYVGVLAIEFFQVDDQLLANEMAPRVHNSGHWTIDGAVTSQFENHLRAILGWPLGSTALSHSAAGMVNLIGTLPELQTLLTLPEVALHLYDKAPRPGRKIGHINLVASDRASLEQRLAAVLQQIDGD